MRQECCPQLGDLGVRGVGQVEPRELGADTPGQPAYGNRGCTGSVSIAMIYLRDAWSYSAWNRSDMRSLESPRRS